MQQPVLALLMSGSVTQRSHKPPSRNPNWQLLAEEGQTQVIFLPIHDINLTTRCGTGYRYSKNRGWQYDIFPLPPFLVDHAFRLDDPIYIERLHSLRKMENLTVVNPPLPNKWRTLRLLQTYQPIAPHLPDSTLLRKTRDIDVWLKHYQTLFLKPVNGCGGRGIMQVQAAGRHHYLLTDTSPSLLTSDDFHRLLTSRMQHTHYLLQQGLDLVTFDKRKIDIRVFLQRDGERKWQAMRSVVKLGARGNIVTNIAQGGEERSPDWLEQHVRAQGLPWRTQEEIEQVALQAADAITIHFPTLCVLGLDIALDTDGNLWMLDLNPGPSRASLDEKSNRRAYRLMIDYARTFIPTNFLLQ